MDGGGFSADAASTGVSAISSSSSKSTLANTPSSFITLSNISTSMFVKSFAAHRPKNRAALTRLVKKYAASLTNRDSPRNL